MFSLRRPTESDLRKKLAAAANLPNQLPSLHANLHPHLLDVETDPAHLIIPTGFILDHTRSQIGQGKSAFHRARTLFSQWKHFDLGWVRVANSAAPIQPGELIAVEVHVLSLWSIHISRILSTVDEPNRFGLVYGTTPLHAENGEERFLLEFDPITGAVHYELLAFSQPAHWLSRLVYPYTRSRQRKFARDSHRRMRELLA